MAPGRAEGTGRGRARGGSTVRRGSIQLRGNGQGRAAAPGSTIEQPPSAPSSRGNTGTPRGIYQPPKTRNHASRNSSKSSARKGTETQEPSVTNGDPSVLPSTNSLPDRYDLLKKRREEERKIAIKDGLLADPDNPRTLAEAITPVGTCEDMCAEFERVERTMQNDVWKQEVGPHGTDEKRMVKKFRRAAAGIDEQLPSDLRPPKVLQRTLNYLFNNLLTDNDTLRESHHFIWDRTRAIRNDFSIQQLRQASDLNIAIECYERIARFHILCLHHFALSQNRYDSYDQYQEREQLDRTLLSLMHYYDDSRTRSRSPNEAEFRVYCIMFQIQDPIPDLEDRVQTWPKNIVLDARVQTALQVYAAACNTADSQGPLRPRAPHPIAQANWAKFWHLVGSQKLSYLMSCVAELYFGLVRRTALSAVWQAYRRGGSNRTEDWTLGNLVQALGFDDEEQVKEFTESYGFSTFEVVDGTTYLDLNSVNGKELPEPSGSANQQRWSYRLVERKRQHRMFSAIINGLSVSAAQKAGLVSQPGEKAIRSEDQRTEDSLFVPEDSNDRDSTRPGMSFNRDSSEEEPAAKLNPFAAAFTPSSASTRSNKTQPNPSTEGTGLNQTPLTFPSPFGNAGPRSVLTNTPSAAFNNINPFKFPGSPSQRHNEPSTTQQSQTQSPFSSATSTFGRSNNNVLPDAQQLSPSPSSHVSASPSSVSTNDPPAPSQSESPKSSPFSVHPPTSTDTAPSNFTQTTPNPFTSSTSMANSFQKQASHVAASTSPFSQFAPRPDSDSPSFFRRPQSSFNIDSSAQSSNAVDAARLSANPWAAKSKDSSLLVKDGSVLDVKTAAQIHSPGAQAAPSHPISADTKTQPASFSTFLSNSALDISKSTVHIPNSTSIGFHGSGRTQPPNHLPQPPAFKPPRAEHGGFSSGIQTVNTNQTLKSQSAQANHPPSTSSPTRPDSNTQPSVPQSRRSTRTTKDDAPNPAEVLSSLARNVVLGTYGFLEQFVEFAAGPLVKECLQQYEDEESRKQADDFRRLVLGHRWFERWRAICWDRRLRRQGRERRQRLARDVQAKARSSRESSMEPDMRGSPSSNETASQSPASRYGRTSSALTPRPNGTTSPPPRPLREAEAKQQQEEFTDCKILSSASPSRRQRSSTPRSQPRQSPNRIVKPFSSVLSGKSSFLGTSFLTGDSLFKQSVLASAGQINTTHSPYFKLKAMGLEPGGTVARLSNRKRAREDDEEERSETETDRIQLPTSSPSGNEVSALDLGLPNGVPAAASNTAGTGATEDDEALFAQIRAARQAMSDSISFFHEEIAKDEASRRSSSEAAPSSTQESSRTPRNAPAYWQRESKFVPREMYGKGGAKRKGKERESPGLDHEHGLANELGTRGIGNNARVGPSGSVKALPSTPQQQKAGTSAEDAIEL